MSAKEALHKYLEKQLRKNAPRVPRQRNQAPEAEVVKSILKWSLSQGWSLHRVESKAVYSASAGRYLRGQTVAGLSDLVGNDSEGRAVYLEVKAKGKMSTLRPGQAVFLKEKIRTNSFAICVDRIELLSNIYVIWLELSQVRRQKYLMDLLPKKFKDI